jgi:HK97 family phage major capsid protein
MTLEREISHSIEQDIKQAPAHGGAFIPLRMSGLDTKTNAAGHFLTAPRVGDILDALINQSRLLSLGARLVTGLRFAQQFPVESAVHQASWVAENSGSDVAASDPTFGMRTVAPHSLQSTTSISRQLLQQANQSLEGWLRSRIARAHALCIDAAAIAGSGVSNEPLGLLKTAGIGDVALGVNGLAPTAQSILDLESAIGAANADSASCAFLTTPAMRKKLRALPSITSGSEPLWDGSFMLGYPAVVSNNVPSTLTKGNNSDCHAILFANWAEMLICEFDGAIEVTVDNYSSKKRGLTELSSYATYDSLLTALGAFAAVQDARAV